ncbi:hypothetical protein J6590_086408 [Homalodisca vitripennis]|nr:hypothetical protein J6590_086408 [Homalodisca vitripennis]
MSTPNAQSCAALRRAALRRAAQSILRCAKLRGTVRHVRSCAAVIRVARATQSHRCRKWTRQQLLRRRKPRRHWVTPILRRRESYGGESMLNDLRIGGQFKIFAACRLKILSIF